MKPEENLRAGDFHTHGVDMLHTGGAQFRQAALVLLTSL
jgi:hypothetical protein